jgi:hypothetical protein
MSTTDETKPAGKSKRRKGKTERSKKAASPASVPEQPVPAKLRSSEQERPSQPVEAERPKVDQMPAVEEPVVAAFVVAAPVVAEPVVADPVVVDAALPDPEPAVTVQPSAPAPTAPPAAEQVSPEPPPANVPPAEPAPVSLQTIANAYRDYTRKSIEDFGSFVEQLSGVRSLDKAMTVQSEFVKRAYETSVAESQKICELHNRLAKQTLDPFKGLTGKAPTTHGKP